MSWWRLYLTDPIWLAGLAVWPLLVWYTWRSLTDWPRWQRLASLMVRAAVVAALVLALAGLTLREPTREQFVVFAVDRSASIGEDARGRAESFLERALSQRGPHRVAFLDWAAQPGTVTAEHNPYKPPERDDETVLGSDLASAIEVAAAAIPPGFVPHIVLLTDGNQTTGDALQAALGANVPISTVPLPPREEPEVQVSEVVVTPQEVRENEPFQIDVVIHANHEDEGVLELFSNRIKVPGVSEERRKLKKGENRFRFAHTLSHERLAKIQAQVKGFQDTLLDNNGASALVYCAGKPRVLIVDSDPQQAEQHLARALEEQDIQVDPPRPPEGVPTSLSELQNYELLILSNVPATKLTQKQMALIRHYVRDLGGGLLMLGGDQSFGLGGWSKSILEDILPVHSDFKKEKEKPSLAMVLVIDKSGSMGDGQKMEMAKEAARGAIELLGPNDKVGVVCFDDQAQWVCEVQSCSDQTFVEDRINRIQIGGGTNMYPGMQLAHEALVGLGAAAKFKHVIMLTDGQSAPGDFIPLAERMATDRITVTTVAMGREGETDKALLEQIARAGGGRFYQAEDPASVPQIFAKETVEAGKEAILEQPFQPLVARPTPVLAGIDWTEAPVLHGYVRTVAKATSEQVLWMPKAEPLLAWWRAGLGMSVAFTSDAKPKWADEWITNWPGGYSKFWAQVVRHAMRKSEARGIEVKLVRRGRVARVTVDAVDPLGRFVSDADAALAVIGPQGDQRELPLRPSSPGRYVAELEVPYSGDYHLLVTMTQQGRLLFQQGRGLAVGYPDELRLRPTDEELLQAIARVSGGAYQPEPEAIFSDGPEAPRALPLWRHLLLAALVLWVVDVALRRIDFASFLAWLRRRPV